MEEEFDLIEFLNKSYAYPINRTLLFGNPEIAYRHIWDGSPLYRITLLGALLIYLKWRNTSRQDRLNFDAKNYTRVESLFNELYGHEPFDLNSAIYILLEGRKDVIARREKSFFYGLINPDTPCEYGKIYSVVDEWKTASDHIIKSYSEEYVNALLVDIVNSLTVLKEYEAFDDNGIYFKKNDEIIKEPLFLKYQDYNYYLLSKIEEGASKVIYEYISLVDFSRVIIEEKR